MQDKIEQAILRAIAPMDVSDITVEISRPEPQFGDYTTNIAMKLAKSLAKNPREVASEIVNIIQQASYDWLQSIEIAGPGFINFSLTDMALISLASPQIPQVSAGMNYVVEYSCPNAFKELHAGHLYQTIVGDVIARMLEQSGAIVHRTNFGGDVGLHVAKAMWGIIGALGGEYPDKLQDIAKDKRPAFLSSSYVRGAAAYESEAEARRQVEIYNQKIYSLHELNDRESAFAQIYWTCRQWSYDYFDNFYGRIQVDSFRYYPESSTAKPGLSLVGKGLERGIFENSDGAVVYRGENVGLHTRVFVTQAGLPTYETKDIGVISLEYQDYAFDHRVLITGRDQTEYMKVVFAAAGDLIPEIKGAMSHFTNGLIKFGDGTKMSSRLGNVTSANDVLNIVYEQLPEKDDETIKNGLMLGAVKYALLKQRLGGDISFDPENSVSLQGNSGPYLQYALVRARSILEKAGEIDKTTKLDFELSERSLLKKLAEFQEVVTQATQEYSPHILCTYLFELASAFNIFYEHNRVIGDVRSGIRLRLVGIYASILDRGLELLGIERLSHM